MNQRENGLDLFRIIAAVMIIITHVCTTQINTVGKAGELTLNYYVFTTFRNVVPAVLILFLMISGAFVLKSEKTADHKSFYRKSWGRIFLPTIVFSVIYLFLESFVYYGAGVYPKDVIGSYPEALLYQFVSTLHGQPAEHMWYMFTLSGLYILAPFAAKSKEMLGEKGFAKASVILYIWGTISNLVSPPVIYWGLGFCVNLLGTFMLGYVIHEWALKRKGDSRITAAAFLLAIVVLVLKNILFIVFRNNSQIQMIISNRMVYDVLSGLAAFCLMVGFTTINIKKDLGKASALTIWVYLVHPAVMFAVLLVESALFHIPYFDIGKEHMISTGLINSLLVAALTFLAAYIIENMMQKRKNKDKAN